MFYFRLCSAAWQHCHFKKKSYFFLIFSQAILCRQSIPAAFHIRSPPPLSTHSSCIFIKIKPSINCKNEGIPLVILISKLKYIFRIIVYCIHLIFINLIFSPREDITTALHFFMCKRVHSTSY